MATQVQLRRGTATENNSFTGAQGELTFDTTNKRVRVHDGATAGGFVVSTADASGNVNISGTLTADDKINIDASNNSRLNIKETTSTDQNTQFLQSSGDLLIRTLNDAETVATNRIALDHGTGDISFYEDTGTTAKFFWDASAESLGIGTSSPASALHIDAADSATGGFRMKNTAGESVEFYYASSAADADFIINRTGSGAADIGLTHTGDVYFTSGSVGIGTSSPSSKLHISGTYDTILDGNSVQFTRAGPSYIQNNTAGGYTVFQQASGEAMRLDSSGSLMVGKTSLGVANLGFAARYFGSGADGGTTIELAKDNATAMYINRTSSDGTIIDLRKDNSTVGSIGTNSSYTYIAGNNSGAGNGSGLNFGTSIEPTNRLGGVHNGITDLGSSSNRFKDLYLSGGVYLGGTGSANKLDDYEEGTWTAAVSGGTTVLTNTTGYYTKIGNVVTFSYYTGTSNLSSPTGGMTITGLPFAASNGSSFNTAVTVAHNTFFGGSATEGQDAYVGTNGTTIYMVTTGTTTTSTFTAGNGKYLMISGTYYTSS